MEKTVTVRRAMRLVNMLRKDIRARNVGYDDLSRTCELLREDYRYEMNKLLPLLEGGDGPTQPPARDRQAGSAG